MYASTLYPLIWWHAHLPRGFAWMRDGDFVAGLPAWTVDVAAGIYLVFASGRGGEELLDDLLARLANDVPTEMSVVRTELDKIAQLRLARVIAV